MISSLIKSWIRLTSFPVTVAMTHHKLRRHAGRARGDVLDIGAGDQPYRRHFIRISSYTATNTRRFYTPAEQAQLEPLTQAWIDGDGPLPFPESSFDAVLCFQVLSVMPDPACFFEECARLLRPSGCLLLATDFLYPKWSHEDVMRHTDVHLRRLAERAGFEVEALESYGGVYTACHACLGRYLRDYPQRLRAVSGGPARVLALLRLAAYLLLLPLHGLAGRFIYLAERNRNDESAYTANHLLIARKKE